MAPSSDILFQSLYIVSFAINPFVSEEFSLKKVQIGLDLILAICYI